MLLIYQVKQQSAFVVVIMNNIKSAFVVVIMNNIKEH